MCTVRSAEAVALLAMFVTPVNVPPAFGSAAPAVVVVEVNIASRAAISTPSTVPLVSIFPFTVKLPAAVTC